MNSKKDLKKQVQVPVRMSQDLRKLLAHIAIDEDTSIQALILEAVAEMLKRRRKSSIRVGNTFIAG